MLEGPEGKASADNIEMKQRKSRKTIQLTGNALVANADGVLRGKIIYFEETPKGNISAAKGNPVYFQGEEIEGKGKILYYIERNNQIRLVGTPAVLWQIKKGKKTNTLSAKKIDYFRDKNRLHAENEVTMLLDSQGDMLQLGEDSQEPETYRLECEQMKAQINKQSEELEYFQAQGKVRLQNVLSNSQQKLKRATGDKLVFHGPKQKGTLFGRPAFVFHERNIIQSPQIDFYQQQKRVVCHGPAQIELQESNSTLLQANKPNANDNRDDKPQKTFIECQGPVEYLDKEKKITLLQDVVVKRKEGTLHSQRLRVFLDENREVKEMTADKNVKLVSEKHSAKADQLRWYEQRRLALLTGYPYVLFRSQETTMQVPMLWYDLDKKRFFTRGEKISIERMPRKK